MNFARYPHPDARYPHPMNLWPEGIELPLSVNVGDHAIEVPSKQYYSIYPDPQNDSMVDTPGVEVTMNNGAALKLVAVDGSEGDVEDTWEGDWYLYLPSTDPYVREQILDTACEIVSQLK